MEITDHPTATENTVHRFLNRDKCSLPKVHTGPGSNKIRLTLTQSEMRVHHAINTWLHKQVQLPIRNFTRLHWIDY